MKVLLFNSPQDAFSRESDTKSWMVLIDSNFRPFFAIRLSYGLLFLFLPRYDFTPWVMRTILCQLFNPLLSTALLCPSIYVSIHSASILENIDRYLRPDQFDTNINVHDVPVDLLATDLQRFSETDRGRWGRQTGHA